MNTSDYSRRNFLRDVAATGVGAWVLAGCTFGDSPKGTPSASGAAARIEGAEVLTDPKAMPAAFKEAPRFQQLVAAGKLPKVADRIGQDPLVIKPLHGVGKYGGTIRRGFLGAADQQNMSRFCGGPDTLFYWDLQGQKIVPYLARGYELSDDNRELIVRLRRGMRWSDGQPFTADDILFWRDDVNLNEEVGPESQFLRLSAGRVRIEKVDEYTVRYVSPTAYALLPELMAGWTDIGGMTISALRGGGGFAPKHYLQKFHPKYTPNAEANAKEAGFKGWVPYLLNRNSWHLNPELPTLTPWITTRPISSPPWQLEANPYSIWVDSEGNQLPYIGSINLTESKDLEVITLRAISGEYDFQDRHLQVASLPVLIKNQERGGYKIHRAPSETTDLGITINLAYDKDPEIGELFRTTDFRRALSLGVDRDQINKTYLLGTSVPSAVMPSDKSPYHPGKEWNTKWATLDVQQANKLLDGIGLTKRDGNGIRLGSSGKPLRIRCDVSVGFINFAGVGEMVKRQWQAIGIDLTVSVLEGNLIVERTLANESAMQVSQPGTEDPFLRPEGFLPISSDRASAQIGGPYGKWFASDGKRGTKPPESLKLLEEVVGLYRRGRELPIAERVKIGQQIYRTYADEVWAIGIASFGLPYYGIYYAKNNLANVPETLRNSQTFRSVCNAYPMTFYYK